MFCSRCGAQHADDVSFCPACGSPIEKVAQEPVQAPAVEPVVIPEPVAAQAPVVEPVVTPVVAQPVYQQPPMYQQSAYQQPTQPKVSTASKVLSIISMCLGIFSLVFFCVYTLAIPFSIAALVLGIIAKSKAKSSGTKAPGMSTAGIVCGSIALGLSLLMVIGLIAGMSVFDGLIESGYDSYNGYYY